MGRTPHRNGFAAKIGLSPITGRILTSKQGRQMIARRRGLWAAQRNRALGWPNLVKGRALRSLYCRFRRCAKAARLSWYEADGALNVLSRMPLDKALAISDEAMLAWMERRKSTALRLPVDPYARLRELRQRAAESVQREDARRWARLGLYRE
jgi:hypothetical protein